jgi:hypothetical protein
MTRAMFFRMLGALGLGQQAHDLPTQPYGCVIAGSNLVCNGKTMQPGGVPKCADDEERCPLGHCQKPGLILVKVYPFSGLLSGQPYHLEQHVCSTCGIVYVPKENHASA